MKNVGDLPLPGACLFPNPKYANPAKETSKGNSLKHTNKPTPPLQVEKERQRRISESTPKE
jgi:hypothetical protein